MTHAYAHSNPVSALGHSNFSWSTAYGMTSAERAAVGDGKLDVSCNSGSTSATPIYFHIDFLVSTPLIGFAVLNHNLATWSSPVVGVQGADDSGFSVNLVTAKTDGNVAKTRNGLTAKDHAFTFPSVSKRYWRIKFNDGGASRIVSFGEIYALTSVTSLTRFRAYGHGEDIDFINNDVQLGTGVVSRTFAAGPIRTLRMPFSDQKTAERDELVTMWNASRGGATKTLFLPFYESTSAAATADENNDVVLGRLQKSYGWTEGDFALFGVDNLVLTSEGREVGA